MRLRRPESEEEQEPLGVLLLPGKLEEIQREQHARSLLAIPRVLALEPPRIRLSRFMRENASGKQAARLKFPGRPRLLVLYHPAQYPLARAILARYDDTELWYVPPAAGDLDEAGQETDTLARDRAAQIVDANADGTLDDESLRDRLTELGIISPYAFLPGRPSRS